MTILSVSRRDYSGEIATTTFRLEDTTAENYEDLAGLADPGQAAHDLVAAVDGVTMGAPANVIFTPYNLFQGRASASDENAQRERKMVVFMEDDTTHDALNIEIGIVNVAEIVVFPNTDQIDLASGGMVALVTALETHHRSKAGNTVSVLSAKLVGRNT